MTHDRRWWVLPAAWVGMGAAQLAAGAVTARRIMASSPDLSLHDTYYVVPHAHYAVSLAAMILTGAAVYIALAGLLAFVVLLAEVGIRRARRSHP